MTRRSNIEVLQYKQKLNVTELLTLSRTSTKQTKNIAKSPDLRGGLETADHCGAVLLFELNSLTYAFCSTNHSAETRQNINGKKKQKGTKKRLARQEWTERNDKHEKTSQDTVRRAAVRLPLAARRPLAAHWPVHVSLNKAQHNTTQQNATQHNRT